MVLGGQWWSEILDGIATSQRLPSAISSVMGTLPWLAASVGDKVVSAVT